MHHRAMRRAASFLMLAAIALGLVVASVPASGEGNPSVNQSLWLFEQTLRDERHPQDPSFALRSVPAGYGDRFAAGRDPGGRGLVLDGSSFYVDNRPNDDPAPFGAYAGDFTVSVTFRYDGKVPPPRLVVNVISSRPTCFASGGFTPHWNIYLESASGRARMQYTSSSATGREAIHAAGPSLFDGKFHEVTMQRSGDTMGLVVDGVEVDSKPVDPGTVGTRGEVWVGSSGCLDTIDDRLESRFVGVIDQAYVADGVATPTPRTSRRRRPATPSAPTRTGLSPSRPPGSWPTTPIPTKTP